MQKRLFIIGAPKCGTTSMAYWLSQHPEITMSSIKEPHYFNTDMRNRTIKDVQAYNRLFSITDKTKVVAEASTWYLFSTAAVPNILASYPDAKFVVMVRDPVEMAISLFYHNRYKLHEPIEDFSLAWEAQEQRAGGENIPVDCIEPAFLQYRAACSLRTLVERIRSQVPAGNLLVVRLEDVRKSPEQGYREILEFVELEHDRRTEFPVLNEAAHPRSLLISHAFRNLSRIKKAWGLNITTGVSKLNRGKLSNKKVSDLTRANIEKDLKDQYV